VFLERIFRIWKGTAWGKAALLLIAGGVVAINGILQFVIPPVALLFGIRIVIPETPAWISFSLICLGIVVLVLSRITPDWSVLPKRPNANDVRFLEEYRALITPALIQFLRGHSFRTNYRQNRLSPLEVIAFDWRGAHYEFQDAELQTALSAVISLAESLCKEIDERIYPAGGNPGIGTSLTDEDRRIGIQPATRDAIKQMNALAKGVVVAANELERLARQKVPT
jgi:hypothetical protein